MFLQDKNPVGSHLVKEVNWKAGFAYLSDILGIIMILILPCKEEVQHDFEWQIRSKDKNKRQTLRKTKFLYMVMTCSIIEKQWSKRSQSWYFKNAKRYHQTPSGFWQNFHIVFSIKRSLCWKSMGWNPFLSLRDNLHLIITL